MDTIYFDNAATSWPKPPRVIEAMNRYNDMIGGNPGRSGHHLSVEAGRIVLETRDLVAQMFNIDDPFQLVFTKNATEALNQAIFGMLGYGGHVITTGMEHNSVMRPLRYLEKHGLEITVVPCSTEGIIDPDDIRTSIRPDTGMIIMTHASNVTGSVMPVKDAGRIAQDHGIVFCVDAAQSAGSIPVDVEDMHISLLAFTGHKSLLGPQGTGGLYIRNGLEKEITPRMMGGTGSGSEFEEQPDFMPDRFESGTPNTIGLAGLGAGMQFTSDNGIEKISVKKSSLSSLFIQGAESISGVHVHGPGQTENRTPVVSFSLDGFSPSEVSQILDEEFGIMSRPGLHCAPAAHRTINTFPEGTVRFSFGYFNTEEEILYSLRALEKITGRKMEK